MQIQSLILSNISKINFIKSNKVSFGSIKEDVFEDSLHKRADELGLKTFEYKNHKNLGKIIVEAVENVKEKGYPYPRHFFFGSGNNKMVEQILDRTVMLFFLCAIYMNPKHEWQDLEVQIKDSYEDGQISSNDPHHAIYHEIGHFINGIPDNNEFNDNNIEEWQEELIIDEVSICAVQDKAEFMAEVFAGHMAERKFSDEVMKLYKEYGGVDLK